MLALLTRPTILPNEFSFLKKIMLHIWAIWSDNLSLFNDLPQTVNHTWCSQRQQLCRILMGEFSDLCACSVPHSPLTRSLMSGMTFSLWEAVSGPLFVSFHPTLCLFLLTSLTCSSKWTWHASHCLTKGMCVCGRCLGRWDLLWDTLISSKPRPGQGGTGQVSGTTRCTPPSCSLSCGSNQLHPSWPSHSFILGSPITWLPSLDTGPFLGASEGGNSEQLLYWGSLLNVLSSSPVCVNLFF